MFQKYVNESTRFLQGVNFNILSDQFESLNNKYINNLLSLEECLTEMARNASNYSVVHPNWALLAGRIEMRKLKMTTSKTFSQTYRTAPDMFKTDFLNFVLSNAEILDQMIVDSRDNMYNYFSVNVLQKTYLIAIKPDDKNTTITLETPQYMWMRTAAYLHYPDLEQIKRTYDDLSTNKYTQATPTLCRAGYVRPQMASCFLKTIPDNMAGIASSWADSALISMNMGGLGGDFSSLRHSRIGHTGESKGVIPWIKIDAAIMKAVDQGGQKRKGSETAQLCDWHVDIFDFIDMKKETTTEEKRALDMTYCIIISDEFMRRVQNDEKWTIMCPKKFPGLVETYGDDFVKKYKEYEKQYTKDTTYIKQVYARDLIRNLILTQMETGGPFVIYKDAMNRKSNQMNLGTIRSSNLCVEIIEYADDNNIASCNLGSIALQACLVRETDKVWFDFAQLDYITRQLVRNINQVIDRNYYHSDKVRIPNLRNRPIGIGVQSLADVFAEMDIIWGSDECYKLNEYIFEAMYYAAVDESANIAIEKGKNYDSFEGSPMSKGLFQFDLWHEEPKGQLTMDDWNTLRQKASKHQYNSLLIAIMPTASSASIFNNNECIEPFTQNIYTRSVLSGQFIMINKHLVRDFINLGIWNEKVITHIINNQGSIQTLDLSGSGEARSQTRLQRVSEELDQFKTSTSQDSDILEHMKLKYRTVYEIPNKVLLNMAIQRGKYVCQSQSLNCWMKNGTFADVYNWHMYGWKHGLKTGMYYFRAPAVTSATNVSLSVLTNKMNNKDIPSVKEITECTYCSA